MIEGLRHTHAPTRRAYGYRPGCLRLAAEVKDYQKQLELEFMSASRARRSEVVGDIHLFHQQAGSVGHRSDDARNTRRVWRSPHLLPRTP